MLMVGIFLSGLDSIYESAKNQMLTSPSIPPIDEAYSRLSRIPIPAATVPDTTSAMLATRGREQPKAQHTAPSSELRVDDLLSQLRSLIGDRPQHAPDPTTSTVTTAASASSSARDDNLLPIGLQSKQVPKKNKENLYARVKSREVPALFIRTVHRHCSSALFIGTVHRSSPDASPIIAAHCSLVTVHPTPLFTRHCSSLFTPDDRASSLTRRHCSLLTPDACSSVWLRLCLCATSLPSPGRSSPVVRRLRLHLRLAPPPELFPVVSASVRRRLPLSFPVLLEGLFPLLTSGTARVFSAPAILCFGSGDLLRRPDSGDLLRRPDSGDLIPATWSVLLPENYFSWSPAMTMGIAARDRMTYIDGSNPEPARTSGVWRTWFLEDNQVKTWIVNSVSPDIQPLILRKKTARDMWVVLEQMYGQKKTDIRTYQVMKTVYNLRQGSSSVAEYYGALKAKWEELDYHS
ncbi:hypothetical protein EJ110_NYTH59702, partial [Nymphaea thermarum]